MTTPPSLTAQQIVAFLRHYADEESFLCASAYMRQFAECVMAAQQKGVPDHKCADQALIHSCAKQTELPVAEAQRLARGKAVCNQVLGCTYKTLSPSEAHALVEMFTHSPVTV